jgi:hypothetical protein
MRIQIPRLSVNGKLLRIVELILSILAAKLLHYNHYRLAKLNEP